MTPTRLPEDSPERVPPAQLVGFSSTASAGLLVPCEETVNENETIARFLQDAGLSAAKELGDVTATADALATHLAGGQALDGGEE